VLGKDVTVGAVVDTPSGDAADSVIPACAAPPRKLRLEEPVTSANPANPANPGIDDAPLTEELAQEWLQHNAFTTAVPGRIGVEVEYLTRNSAGALPDAGQVANLDRSGLPSGGRVTEEPGGQLEVSTRTCNGLADAVLSVRRDGAELRRRAAASGMQLVGEGTDALYSPRRLTEHPRYRAMETYLDRYGDNGRRMMCSTASLQITVESGRGSQVEQRWQMLHDVGPALIATFANSPFIEGKDSGWVSARQGIWWSLDPHRCWPIPTLYPGRSARDAYASYALDAPVLLVRHPGDVWQAAGSFSFREWLNGVAAKEVDRAPTLDDLTYHITTLFPPVRPRGAVEVRYLDAQRGEGWLIPLAVVYALVYDDVTTERARAAAEPIKNGWADAARHGLADLTIRKAAVDTLATALDCMTRHDEPA